MMQLPGWSNVTVDPDKVQIPTLLGSRLKTTARPEVEVAVIVYGAMCGCGFAGGVEVIVIVCEPRPTAKDCWTCGAARELPLPAWFAGSGHVPPPTNATLAPETVQTPALPAEGEKATARPELAVAVTV